MKQEPPKFTRKQLAAVKAVRSLINQPEMLAGTQLPSERDLAVSVGVSRPTLRAAIERLEREGLVERKARSGLYIAAKQQVTDPSHKQDVVPNPTSSIVAVLGQAIQKDERKRCRLEGYLIMIMRGVLDELYQSGLGALTIPPSDLHDATNEAIARVQPRGIIDLRGAYPIQHDGGPRTRKTPSSIPTVRYGYESEYPYLDTVGSDQQSGCYMLTQWMLKQGKKRILPFFALNAPNTYPLYIQMRLAGYEQAMREAGHEPMQLASPPYYPNYDIENQGEFRARVAMTLGYLYPLMQSENRPEAILTQSDDNAYLVTMACQQMGIKPGQDILIAGYDNYWYDSSLRHWVDGSLPQVTIDKQNSSMGKKLVEMLEQRIGQADADSLPMHVQCEPKLVEITDQHVGNRC